MKKFLRLITITSVLCCMLGAMPCYAQQEMKLQVENVKSQLRKGDFSSLKQLRQNSQEALPLLKGWANDESDNVRYGLIAVASEQQSRQALLEIAKVLSLNDPNRRIASNAIFRYGALQTNALLDINSKKVFVDYLSQSFEKRADTEVLMIISAVDAKKALFLVEQLKSEKVAFYMENRVWLLEKDFLLDLLKLQGGEQTALNQKKFDAHYEKIPSVIFSLYCIAWINKKNAQYQVENFKLDKRVAIEYDTGEGQVRKKRICDIALESFAYILGIRSNVGNWTGKIFEDDKLTMIAQQMEAKVKDAMKQETPYLEIGK